MPPNWMNKLRVGSGWTAVISAFVFLFLWQMTSAVMPTLDPRSTERVPGPFADSAPAIAATIASLFVFLGSLACFLSTAAMAIWSSLRSVGHHSGAGPGGEGDAPPSSGKA